MKKVQRVFFGVQAVLSLKATHNKVAKELLNTSVHKTKRMVLVFQCTSESNE